MNRKRKVISKMADASKAAEEFGLSDAIPDGWRPEEGDLVIGRILALQAGWSEQQNRAYPILIVHDEVTDKDISVHGFHFVLMDRLTRLQPQVGERVGIRMGPKVPLKGDSTRSVQTYTVKVEGRSENIWSQIKNPRVQPQQTQLPVPTDVAATEAVDEDIPF